CFSCVGVCPQNELHWSQGVRNDTKVKTLEENSSRRHMLMLGSSWLFTGFIQKAIPKITRTTTIPEARKNFSMPPGASDAAHFHELCTACHLCIGQCPSQVLQPAGIEYGIMHIMQPVMNYRFGYCTFECKQCTDICPTGALHPLAIDIKKLTRIGTVKFIQKNCVVELQGTDCGACSEHCPTKAVTMVPYKNVRIPALQEKLCIGCGACEHACPMKPFKAMYVEGEIIQGIADRPAAVQENSTTAVPEEFPF
ncbi:MAG: 4Fe-4S dicluster domain-containing protein, partial [Ignavibacteria bacterium]|nr:4Fe-4S dicluster domain-containing protein [Ignavibacteria bacterium]